MNYKKVPYLRRDSQIGNFLLLFRYVLTQTDYFSKYVQGCPIKDKSAHSVTEGLYRSFCRQGAPVHVISDQGRNFLNQVSGQVLHSRQLGETFPLFNTGYPLMSVSCISICIKKLFITQNKKYIKPCAKMTAWVRYFRKIDLGKLLQKV